MKSWLSLLIIVLTLSGCPKVAAQNHLEVSVQTPIELTSLQVERIPPLKHAYQISDKSLYSPEEISIAIQVFYHSWKSNFGDEDEVLLEALNNITVVWKNDVWKMENVIVFKQDGTKIVRNIVVSGITHNKHMLTAAAKSVFVEETSLVHELMHIAIWNVYPESRGDPDHEGDKWDYWSPKHSALIDLINIRLAAIN